MYLVVRCSGCSQICATPQNRQHILCPVCGVTTAISDTRVYLWCKERSSAEDISVQLMKIIAGRHGQDLDEEEIRMLRSRFEAWERQNTR